MNDFWDDIEEVFAKHNFYICNCDTLKEINRLDDVEMLYLIIKYEKIEN